MNNTIFKCILDEKWYNFLDTQVYGIGVAVGLVPQGQQTLINLNSQLICGNCWKENQDKGLNLKEPSQIVTAPANALNGIKKPMN